MKQRPRVIIERVVFDKDDHVSAVDLHDEKFGEGVFCDKSSRHTHGRYGYPYKEGKI